MREPSWTSTDGRVRLYLGDCAEVLADLEAESIDAVVTDPPYGLAFMGKRWDYDVPTVDAWRAVLRVRKPGGHLLAFAGTRTCHRMAVAIEDAGFEIRDMIAWLYGSGFPKGCDVGKATAEAQRWDGWGTALKPAMEPITVSRKPLVGTVAENVLEHGTGGINIDGCRMAGNVPSTGRGTSDRIFKGLRPADMGTQRFDPHVGGRWPANVIHDGSEEVVERFPDTGNVGSFRVARRRRDRGWCMTSPGEGVAAIDNYGDSGSAARFFYCAKASRSDRGPGNDHPTVKPLDLMRYLCRLVTPPGGLILDPFLGSGTTALAAVLEGFHCIGIELDPAHLDTATRRIDQETRQARLFK